MGKKSSKKKSSNRVLPALNADAFVIGNGTSRKGLDLEPLLEHGNVYGCNWFFRDEFMPTVIVASDEPMTMTILKAHSNAVKQRKFYTWFPKPGSGSKKASCPEKFAAGPMAAWTAACDHQAKRVFLIGVDFFGFGSKNENNNGKINNLYAGEKHYTDENVAPTYRNWQRRFQYIIRAFPNVEFWHINPFEGKSPERLIGLPNFHATTWDNFQDHLNEGVDLTDDLVKDEAAIKLASEPNPTDLKACLERQIAGQENTIFADLIPMKQIVEIRKQVSDIQASGASPSMAAAVNIFGQEITVPFARLAKGIAPPTREQIAASVELEDKQRKRISQEYWNKTGLRPIPIPITKEMVMAKPKSQFESNGIVPPPPPPPKKAVTNMIPPPPPPVFQ